MIVNESTFLKMSQRNFRIHVKYKYAMNQSIAFELFGW